MGPSRLSGGRPAEALKVGTNQAHRMEKRQNPQDRDKPTPSEKESAQILIGSGPDPQGKDQPSCSI
jgi:hypothetical protein